MSLEANPKTWSPAEPGLNGAGSGTSNPEISRPVCGSTLYSEHPRVNGSASPLFSTCHCTPTVSPPSATSSIQNLKDGGRLSAHLLRCAFESFLAGKRARVLRVFVFAIIRKLSAGQVHVPSIPSLKVVV